MDFINKTEDVNTFVAELNGNTYSIPHVKRMSLLDMNKMMQLKTINDTDISPDQKMNLFVNTLTEVSKNIPDIYKLISEEPMEEMMLFLSEYFIHCNVVTDDAKK